MKSPLNRSILVSNNVDTDKKAQLRNPKTAAALERNAVIRNRKPTEIKRRLHPFSSLNTFDNRLFTECSKNNMEATGPALHNIIMCP